MARAHASMGCLPHTVSAREGVRTAVTRERALRWLVNTVIVLGVVVSGAVLVLRHDNLSGVSPWLLPALTGLVAVSSAAVVRVRLRSTVIGTTWVDAAMLVCIVYLPPAWVPLCVGTGVLVAKLFLRVAPLKAAYNAAKDALSASAGLLVAIPLGVVGLSDPLARPLQLFAVSLAAAVMAYVIGVPVLALASGMWWKNVLCNGGLTKVGGFLGKYAVAVLALRLLETDPRLIAVMPSVVLCLHLLYASRLRAQAERAAWQRLAATTDELNSTDLKTVLTTAVVNAATLFEADGVEVFVRDVPDGPLLVRGDAAGVSFYGPPARAPMGPAGESVTVPLTGVDENPATGLGELRLNFKKRVTLTDRERLTLRTFVAALRTAVRNAAAFAETKRLAVRNAEAALRDPLTGLANRRHLQVNGDELLNHAGVAALVVLDLNMFREVNETLGHLAGDRLLVEVGRRLGRTASGDDVVARLGGDEFAALYLGLPSVAAADQRARELLATLDAPIELNEVRVRVEASAGLAVLDRPHERPDATPESGMVELLRRADVAMYQAKRGGPPVVRYEAAHDTADIAQLMLGGDLPRAVQDREFAVLFQPIVDLASGQMIGAEALARWHHPARGHLDPRRFLTAVERSGLLPAFVESVLDQALATMLRWRALGLDGPVAVNASPRSLLDPTFPRMVADRLAAHGARSDDLVIELTESLTVGQVELVGGVLRELRDAGLRLALDDFGTGFSSLSMLAKVRVSELKIDRSFVSAMASSPEAAAVVRSTIELGRSLGLLVVAEGVESDEQRRTLWELGCPAGQGHLFARGVHSGDLLRLVEHGIDGTPGRLAQPIHGPLTNVIDMPRPRRGENAGTA
jgi:diguanylate cyclase (GGDEF)-like protein